MRSAEECLAKASEMELFALACPGADMAINYQQMAASWRRVARLAARQDGIRAPLLD